MSHTIVPVILSGGGGTRLWPLSRAAYPKQLTRLTGEASLLQGTVLRAAGAAFAAPLVICHRDYRFLVAQQLDEIDVHPGAIVLEPVGRNTAPAAATAALLASRSDPEALIVLLPSDHRIEDAEGFRGAVARAAPAAAAGWIVTFGITPDRAETGYGYIEQGDPLAEGEGCYRVRRFVEKPDAATAAALVAAGTVSWNSGMFLASAPALIEELERFQPEVVAACRAALDQARREFGFLCLDEGSFASATAISLDYAVMERTERAAVLPVDIGWSDIGSWDALWRIGARDPNGNSLVGDVVALDSHGNYLHSERPLVAAVGIENLAVVATPDAVLVCPRERAQQVREMAARLKDAGRPEVEHHPRVYRPWGSYEPIDADEGFQAKRLILNPGASISLQRHRHRAEHWVVVRGTAEVTRDGEVFRLGVNESTHIPIGAVHRLHNPGDEALHIVEVQCGDYLGEDDIERLEDVYGRG